MFHDQYLLLLLVMTKFGDQNARGDFQSCFYTGTSFNLEFDFKSIEDVQFVRWQRERCPNSGKEHLQWALQFKRRKRVDKVLKLLSGCHVERARDFEACLRYVSKSESRVDGPWEFGSRGTGSGSLDVTAYLCNRSVKGLLLDVPSLWRSVRSLQTVRGMMMKARSERTGLVYLWGATGAGKTFMMNRFSKYMDVFWYNQSGWWCGYDQQPIVVVDEFHGQMDARFILKLGDYTPLSVPIKGGMVQFDSILVVFLSNLDPEKTVFLHGDEINAALRRRFSVIQV